MKNILTYIIVLPLLILSMVSCNRPKCHNSNPIFDEFDVESEEYKSELAIQINKEGMENLKYWLKSYEYDHMYVYIQNGYLCAIADIQINDWKGLEGIRKSGGGGWSGAELSGLKFDIIKDSTGTHFLYKGVDKVLD